MSQQFSQDDPQSSQQAIGQPTRQPLNFAALMPNHRDLYVLAAGLILGVLLGPAVLGRYSPETYHRFFPSEQAAQQQLGAHDGAVALTMQKLVSTEVTSVALEEFAQTAESRREPFLQAVAEARHARGRLVAAMIAVLLVMILETLPEASAIILRSRLATARYAMMALVIALLMAQPSWLLGVSTSFILLLLVVGLGVALVPLSAGRQAKS